MNILIAPNNYYVMPSIVLLQSLFDVAEEQMDVYLMYSKLEDSNLSKLENFITNRGGNFHPILVNAQAFDAANVSGHITLETYYRLLAQDLLPAELDRVLYLDADIIVMCSLQKYYYMPFKNTDDSPCYYVVCEGPGISKRARDVYDNLEIPYEYPYFNAGVLLINLSLLRKTYDTKTSLEYIRRKGENLSNHDQDTLNALFYDKVKYVDWHIYNQTILHIADKHEAKLRLDHAKIIHFAGPDKPWNYNYSSWYFNEFWKCALRAGYKTLYMKILTQRYIFKAKRLFASLVAWLARTYVRLRAKLTGKSL